MPSLVALGGSMLATLGGIAALVDRDYAIAPYFVITAPLIGVAAWGLTGVGGLPGLVIARLITFAIVAASGAIAALLLMERVVCGCSGPIPVPDPTVIGIPVTILHLVGTFGAAALVASAAILQYRAASRQPPGSEPQGPPPA